MNTSQQDLEVLENLSLKKQSFFNEIGKVLIGQEDILDHILIALLSQGHTLLVGVPGLAKTLLVQTLSEVLNLSFKRIQFTPDLMPSDITGTELIDIDQNTGQRSFRFHYGPIFANLVLADEINRTPPKTQAALLEAMQEHRVTAGGKTYNLDKPFFVLATQNPIEQEGTYPLPEAQLDRFMFNLNIDYPSEKDEISIVRNTTTIEKSSLKPIMNKEDLISFQKLIRKIPISDNVVEYAVKLVGSTRPQSQTSPDFIKQHIDWGAGPRASTTLISAAKACALINGRVTPEIDDIKLMIKPVLRHRIIPNFNAEAEGLSRDDILDEILASLK